MGCSAVFLIFFHTSYFIINQTVVYQLILLDCRDAPL
jgi:hypothetical protein